MILLFSYVVNDVSLGKHFQLTDFLLNNMLFQQIVQHDVANFCQFLPLKKGAPPRHIYPPPHLAPISELVRGAAVSLDRLPPRVAASSDESAPPEKKEKEKREKKDKNAVKPDKEKKQKKDKKKKKKEDHDHDSNPLVEKDDDGDDDGENDGSSGELSGMEELLALDKGKKQAPPKKRPASTTKDVPQKRPAKKTAETEAGKTQSILIGKSVTINHHWMICDYLRWFPVNIPQHRPV